MNLHYMSVNGYEMQKVDILYMHYGYIPALLCGAILMSVGLCILEKNLMQNHRIKLLEHIVKQSLTKMVVHLYGIQFLQMISHKLIGALNSWIIFITTTFILIIGSFNIERYLPFLYDINAQKSKIINKKVIYI